jgi:hypothetical protein
MDFRWKKKRRGLERRCAGSGGKYHCVVDALASPAGAQERRELRMQRIVLSRERWTASRRQTAPQSAAMTKAWTSIGSAEIFPDGAAHTTTKYGMYRAGRC